MQFTSKNSKKKNAIEDISVSAFKNAENWVVNFGGNMLEFRIY